PRQVGISDSEFRGAIQMLTQLLASQSSYQGSAPTNFISHDSSGASRLMNPPIFMGSK
ncbi:hypothetical protein HAX54_038021, partial [Datura stramonium]|nr:hypothetical protein [Datura stramonium]